MSTSAPGKTELSTMGVSLQALIDAPRRLDELGTARLIGEAAAEVHKAQKNAQPLGTLSPDAIVVLANGHVKLKTPPASVAYTAPERLKGSVGDRRSDVFSLGVILWEALAHARLFEGANDEAIKTAVMTGEIRPASEMNANIPAELDAICKKALSREPADRYQSAKVMAAEIDAVLDDAGYPESNENIARFLASEPELLGATAPKGQTIGKETVLGVAALRDEPKPAAGKKAAKEAKKAAKQAATAAATSPATTAAPSPAHAAAPSPAKEAAAAASAEPPRAKSPSGSPLPSWAMAQPSDAIAPVGTLAGLAPKPPAEIVPDSPKPPAVIVPDPPKLPAQIVPDAAARGSTTTPGMAAQPALDLKATTLGVPPSPSVLADAPVPAAPQLPATVAGVQSPTLPKAVGAQTAILGSPNAVPASSPSPLQPTKTAVLGSGSLIDQLPSLPPGATEPAEAPPSPPVPATPRSPVAPSIANAETVATPALAAAAVEAAAPAASARPVSPSQVTAMPAAGSLPAADDDFAEDKPSGPHPAAVVALPRAKTRPDGTKGDVLAGWGWGTDSHEAITDDDDYEDTGRASRKRLLIAIGGAGVAVLLITVVAFAFGGGSDDAKPEEPAATANSTVPAIDQVPAGSAAGAMAATPVEPAPVEPATETETVTEPETATEPATELATATESDGSAAGAVEPPPPEPEPEPEPAKAEPEPAKVAKAEPPKAAKVTKKAPPRKAPPRKRPPRKDPPRRRVAAARPVDPYAEPRRLNVNAAYKTGIQQFARGDSNGALTTFKASLASNPNYAPTWRGIGLVYEKLGKKSQARTAFRRYLQLSPTAGDAEQIRNRLERLGS